MSAAEMQWPAAFAVSVFLVCCAAVVIYVLHLVAHTEPVDRPTSTPPEWRSEMTVTRGANPAPEPRTKDKPPEPPPDPKEKGR